MFMTGYKRIINTVNLLKLTLTPIGFWSSLLLCTYKDRGNGQTFESPPAKPGVFTLYN